MTDQPLQLIKGRKSYGVITSNGLHLVRPDRAYPRLDNRAAKRVCSALVRSADWTLFDSHDEIPPALATEVRQVICGHSITQRPEAQS